MRPTVLFAGPSISGLPPSALAELDVRPPAACGDIARATRDGASTIALIDGIFETAAAPWHKEILWALSKGVVVYGASSMGALRAAEMHEFGMQGVGLIYRLYRTCAIVDDDEVALVHGPREMQYEPLTEAMINVRVTLREARRRRIISREVESAVARTAKRIFYKHRTYAEIFRRADLATLPAVTDLQHWIVRNVRDAKRADAMRLIQHVRSLPVRHARTPPAFVSTRLWTIFQEEYLADTALTPHRQ